jgi:hypothetical protein
MRVATDRARSRALSTIICVRIGQRPSATSDWHIIVQDHLDLYEFAQEVGALGLDLSLRSDAALPGDVQRGACAARIQQTEVANLVRVLLRENPL